MVKVEVYSIRETAGVAGEGYHHNGQAARPNVYQLSHTLGESRSKVNDHYTGYLVGLGISPGHRGNRAFVESQDAMYIRTRV
jgi:hypothetical protein